MVDPKIITLKKDQISVKVKEIARLRIDIFREFPYLYDGDLDYESKYLKKFANTPDSIIIILQDGDKIVGAITGLPLFYEEPNVRAPWIDNGLEVDGVYYFSEILLYSKYRGKGYGAKIFALAEKTVATFNRYNQISLATVVREDDHPLKPKHYVALDYFWQARGYERKSNFICHIPWKDLTESEETNKPLVFWLKNINLICQISNSMEKF